mgnify:CR=1 FL=1
MLLVIDTMSPAASTMLRCEVEGGRSGSAGAARPARRSGSPGAAPPMLRAGAIRADRPAG